MFRSQFIAARNSRHRTAAVALYRALVRTASQVPVPQDALLGAKAGTGIGAAARGPIVDIVRKRFAKNKTYSSFRLIYASMAAGYKFLTLLTKAQVPNSPEHNQILNHLQARYRVAAADRAASRPRPKAPELPSEPLLINIAKPGEPPKYTSNILPRPESSLTRPRKVPDLCATADGQPFVRIKKPQPRALSRMVGRKGKIFVNRITSIVEIDEEIAPAAALEDEWDAMMDDLVTQKERSERQQTRPSASRVGNAQMETFGWSVQLSRLWYEWKVEQTWEDWVARGDALHDLVEQERILAEQEQGGNAQKQIPKPLQIETARKPDGVRPNVASPSYPALPVLEAGKFELAGQVDSAAARPIDPFISPAWAALINVEKGRMLKWTGRNAGEAASSFDYSWKRPGTAQKSTNTRQ